MKAIETRYRGYRFRSRLEARWAVFFDHLKIPWLYEVEGYELPSGRYLPDFWLPDHRIFVEVKGDTPTKRERKICDELRTYTGSATFVVYGLPVQYWGRLSCFEESGECEFLACFGFDTEGMYFCAYRNVGKVFADRSLSNQIQLEAISKRFVDFDLNGVLMNPAAEAARSARFEFGESGSGA